MFDTFILAIASALAAVAIGELILDEARAVRAPGRRISGDLAWTLLWASGLSVLFIAAWVSRAR